MCFQNLILNISALFPEQGALLSSFFEVIFLKPWEIGYILVSVLTYNKKHRLMKKSVKRRLRFNLVVEQMHHMVNPWFYYHKKKKEVNESTQ